MKKPTAKSYPRVVTRGSASVRITRTTNRGAPSYVVSYISGDRGRVQFRFVDEVAAKKKADEIVASLAAGDHEASKLSGADRSALVEAERALAPVGVSIVAAANAFAEACRILGGNRVVEAAQFFRARSSQNLPDYTVADAVALYVAAKQAEGISKKYRKTLN